MSNSSFSNEGNGNSASTETGPELTIEPKGEKRCKQAAPELVRGIDMANRDRLLAHLTEGEDPKRYRNLEQGCSNR
ncbi:MAG: hypothetical protein KDI68_02700 [Gammaproteobacteria bacterium]|nr:hypothetical protein [Gammaproteobacteria bacterium]